MSQEAPGAPPRRSDATRAAILEAARERFASDGYERATIRAIARDAGIDPSMVMRYYGNKEGLFAAASAFVLRMPVLGAVPTRHIGAVLVHHFLDQWEQDDGLPALLRASVTNPVATERARRIFSDQLLSVLAPVCPWPEEAPRRTALVASHMLGIALTRYVLKFPPVAGMSREEVVAWTAPTIQRCVTGEPPAVPGPPPPEGAPAGD